MVVHNLRKEGNSYMHYAQYVRARSLVQFTSHITVEMFVSN